MPTIINGETIVTLQDLADGYQWPEPAKPKQPRIVHTPVVTPPTKQRNMLFFVWPTAADPEGWRRTVLRLLQHIEQFDGVRSVAIVTGPGCEPVETVQAEFRGVRIDNWIIKPNDPNLGEVVTWLDLLETVREAGGMTWYGHSKATSYAPDNWGPQAWMEAMFEATLSMPHQNDRLLIDEGFVIAGPFRKHVRGWAHLKSLSDWHFSGTFFWFDNARIFSRDWAKAEPHRWGVEAWPSLVAAFGEAACITGADTHYGLHRWGEWTGVHRHSHYMAKWRDRAIAEKFHPARPAETALADRLILNVITAVSRPGNLGAIQEYLVRRLPSFDVRWWCVADSTKVAEKPEGINCQWLECSTQGVGGPQRNVALEQIADGWVWCCDDDNIPHPQFDRELSKLIAEHSNAAGFVFHQETLSADEGGLRLAAPENCREKKIDMAQIVLSREAVGVHRFTTRYEADWDLFKPVWNDHRDRIHFGGVASYYNGLQSLTSWGPVTPPHWAEIVKMEAAIGSLDGLRIVEPGSHAGRCTAALAGLGATVTAIEPREPSLRIAGIHCSRTGVADRVELIHGDVTKLEAMQPDQFDLLFHAGLLYHLESPVDHFRKVARLCRWMFLDTHYADGRKAPQFGPMTTHEGVSGQWYTEPENRGPLDGLGPKSFWLTETALQQLVEECGLRIVQTLKRERDHCGRGARVAWLLERVQ